MKHCQAPLVINMQVKQLSTLFMTLDFTGLEGRSESLLLSLPCLYSKFLYLPSLSILLINIFKAPSCSDLLFGVNSQPSEDNQVGNNFNYIKDICYKRK